MITALDYKQLCEKLENRYKFGKQCVVGILLARYGMQPTTEIVNQHYLYWNKNTKNYFDVFWAGYGEYLCSDDQSPTKKILDFEGNNSRIYFDLDAFISIKDQFNGIFKCNYEDSMKLILVNYRDGRLHFNESICIDLEENLDTNYQSLRNIMEFLRNTCAREYSVTVVARRIFSKRLMKKIKGVTLSAVIKTAMGIIGKFKS